LRLVPTPLAGVLLVEPQVHRDERGFLVEVYQREKFAALGLDVAFVQDNHSASRRGVLRGLHLQHPEPQGKLVRVPVGEVFDVAVDVRVGSPQFGRWFGARLSGDDLRALWIPPGFAHGFCVLSETAHVEYKCTTLYRPGADLTIRWDDPAIGIDWPVDAPVLSAKDAGAPPLAALVDRLPRYVG
jgi:dTDP-4-dehydrorhamnose 3,5-epimerase